MNHETAGKGKCHVCAHLRFPFKTCMANLENIIKQHIKVASLERISLPWVITSWHFESSQSVKVSNQLWRVWTELTSMKPCFWTSLGPRSRRISCGWTAGRRTRPRVGHSRSSSSLASWSESSWSRWATALPFFISALAEVPGRFDALRGRQVDLLGHPDRGLPDQDRLGSGLQRWNICF